MKKRYKVKDYALMGILISFGIILQVVDNLLIISGTPGGKLGLANIISLLNIFMFGTSNALIISVLRAFIGTILFGGVSAVLYSVLGAFFSTLLMAYLNKKFYPRMSEIGISISGAAMHNFTQVLVAALLFQNNKIFSYMSVLFILSVFAGFATGLQVKVINKKILAKGKFKTF